MVFYKQVLKFHCPSKFVCQTSGRQNHWSLLGIEKKRYKFWIFKFQFWIFEKTSKFWAASYKNESNLLLVRITVCIKSFLPIGWRTFILKIRQRTALFWSGLQDVGILHSQAVIQRTIVVSPAFLEHGLAERSRFVLIKTVIWTSRRIRTIFVFSGSELWTLFKY
jgi:hypothetical protein